MITDSVNPRLTPNVILRTAVSSARDASIGIVSIHESGHTYLGKRVQGKCGYLSLTPNALLPIAVCSAQDAPLGIVSIYKAGQTYTG